MVNTPMIWASGGRKEAIDLLTSLWADGTDDVRQSIEFAILAGPPDDLLARVDDADREKSKDRRIFDRLKAIESVGEPPLTPGLETEAARLAAVYPYWVAPEGERASFSSWSEYRLGPETDFVADDLAELTSAEIATLLVDTADLREGLMDAWKGLADDDPEKGIVVLEQLATGADPGPPDIWEYGLWGLRGVAKKPELRSRILAALERLPNALTINPEMARSSADFLEAAASSRPSPTEDPTIWALFDRTLSAAKDDPSNEPGEDEGDAVSHAINCSMGRLAQAFFALLFARSLKVWSKLPKDLRPRADALINVGVTAHRPARVIAASRLSYLFAVDPDWTQDTLIPGFDWDLNEAEAAALWQGYAWQPRIDEKLWPAIRPFFLPVFQAERLERIGDMARSLVQLLMLIGIDLERSQLPANGVRNALRAMSDRHRAAALSWIAGYLSQPDEPGEVANDARPSKSADTLWVERVGPWLEAVWPPEPQMRTGSTSEQFAQIAIATNDQFPNALERLAPFIVRTNAYYELDLLRKSQHPDRHPRATLQLIDALAERQNLAWGTADLAAILARAQAAEPAVVNLAIFNELSGIVQANPE